MPNFVCDGCNRSLRKKQVDMHFSVCRVCTSVSCLDCNVSFSGEEYACHNSCVTEAQKFEGKNRLSGQESKKQQWSDYVLSVSENCSEFADIEQKYLKRLSKFAAIPKSPTRFTNFFKNCVGVKDPLVIDRLFKKLLDGYNSQSPQLSAVVSMKKARPSHSNVNDDDVVESKTTEDNDSNGEQEQAYRLILQKLSSRKRKADDDVLQSRLVTKNALTNRLIKKMVEMQSDPIELCDSVLSLMESQDVIGYDDNDEMIRVFAK